MAKRLMKWSGLAALVSAACLPGAAQAIGLLKAYEAALANDPVYRSAYYANQAGQENRLLGRSNLLPVVSGNYSGSRNNYTIGVLGRELEQKYISRSATVSVRQSVFNLDGLARYKQGAAQSRYAEAQFDRQSQEVLVRVVSAYFEVLFKQDQLALAKIERDMYIEQRNVNDLLFKRGEGTTTDVLETQSRLDLAEAALLEAGDNLTVARDTLAEIIGQDPGELAQLRAGFRAVPVGVKSFDEWKQIALDSNPDIRTLRQGVEIALQEVNKQRAGHYPRLDVVGTYGKTASDSITTIDQDQTIRSIGFQLSVPLYSGGAISASTRQAAANLQKAKADLDAQSDKVLVDLRRYHKQVASSVPRVDALIKAVDSASLLIKATEQSIKGGVRINLDLLNAQRQLYTAQRDLAQARYGFMLAELNLRASAGVLSADDVKLVAAYFE